MKIITDKILERGFVTINGEKISDDCKIDFSKISPIVKCNYDDLKPIGELKSIIEHEGGISCEFKLDDTLVKELKWYKRLINNLFSIFGFKEPYSQPNSLFDFLKNYCGFGVSGIVTEREGNVIKDIKLMEVSLIRKNK